MTITKLYICIYMRTKSGERGILYALLACTFTIILFVCVSVYKLIYMVYEVRWLV